MFDVGESRSLDLHNGGNITSGLRNNNLVSERITTRLRDVTPEVSSNKTFTFLIDDEYSRCHSDGLPGN